MKRAIILAGTVSVFLASAASADIFKTVYATGLADPAEIAFGPDGSLFCGRSANQRNLSLYRVPPGGGVATEWGDAVLADPDGIDVDAAGNVYSTNGLWSNQQDGEVILLDVNGNSTPIGSNYLRNCMSVELDRSARFGSPGSILVGVQSSDVGGAAGSEIIRVDPYAAGGPQIGAVYQTNQSIYLWSMAFDHEGSLWFMHGIGLMKWSAGQPSPQEFALNGVPGEVGPVAFDPATNTMIMGLRAEREVVRVSTDGTFLELLAEDLDPTNIAVDSEGVIYVSDGVADVIWAVPEPATLSLLTLGGLALLRRRR